jgi:hypothetical protein
MVILFGTSWSMGSFSFSNPFGRAITEVEGEAMCPNVEVDLAAQGTATAA